MPLYLVAYTSSGVNGSEFRNCLREYPDIPESTGDLLIEDGRILAMEYGLDTVIITHWGRLLAAEDFGTPAGPFCYIVSYHFRQGLRSGFGIMSLHFVSPLLTMADVKRAEEIIRSHNQLTAVTALSLSPSPHPWAISVEWAQSLTTEDADQA